MEKRYAYSTESDELLLDRARDLRGALDQNISALRTYVCFTAGGSSYAIDSRTVVQVFGRAAAPSSTTESEEQSPAADLPPFLRIPEAPPFLPGIINIRGALHAVLDLSRLLFDSATMHTPQSRLILVQSGDIMVGIPTEDSPEMLVIHDDEIQGSTETMPPELQGILMGAIPFHGTFIGLVDGARLAAHPKLATLTR